MVLPPQRRPRPPPYTGKVLREKVASWYHGVSPPSHQARLDSLVAALKNLADRGLNAGCVLSNLHHQRIVPLMERRLHVFEMSEDADPIALGCRGCCGAPSRGSTRPPGRGAPSTSGRGVVITHPCGHLPCSPSAHW
jgi:hypothetical protein